MITVEKQAELQRAFFKLFGGVFPKLIKEKDVHQQRVDERRVPPEWANFNGAIARPLETLNSVNSKYPIQVHFNPNGNYGDKFEKMGKQVGCKIAEPGTGPYHNALVVDGDIKDVPWVSSMKEYFNDVLLPIIEHAPPSVIAISGGGFHLYYIFDTLDREKIAELYSDSDMYKMSLHLSKLIPGGDLTPARHRINGFIRAPFSYWMKKPDDPVLVKAVVRSPGMTYDDLEDACVVDPKEFNHVKYISVDELETIYLSMTEHEEVAKEVKKKEKKSGKLHGGKIDELGIVDVIDKLGDWEYDRAFTIRDHGARKNVLGRPVVVNGNCISIRETKTGTLYPTNGYTVFKEKNCVVNFTMNPDDCNVKRPEGSPYSFVSYYLGGDPFADAFFEKVYGIQPNVSILKEGEKIYHEYKSQNNWYEMILTNTRVYGRKMKKTGKQKREEREIFDFPMKIIGKARTRVSVKHVETDTDRMVYLIEDKTGRQAVIEPVPSVSRWNSMYQHRLGFCVGTDLDIGMFFQALEDIDTIPDLEFRFLGGYYEDAVYFIGNKIYEKEHIDTIDYFKDIGKIHDGKQIKVKAFLKELCKVVDENVAILAVLSGIAMMGMNTWAELGENINPAVFFTGLTSSGKTTIADIIRAMIGFLDKGKDQTERQRDIRSVSAKPMKQLAGAHEPFFITEISGDVSREKIATFRNIINRESGSRGTAGIENEEYVFRSPLLVQGERLAEEESVNNRMCIIGFKESQKKVIFDQEGLADDTIIVNLKQNTCYLEIAKAHHKAYTNLRKNLKAWAETKKTMARAGLTNRDKIKRGFLFHCSKLVDIGVKEDRIIEAIKRGQRTGGGDDEVFVQKIDPISRLKDLLTREVMRRNCLPRRYLGGDAVKTEKILYEISLTSDFIQRNKQLLSEIIYEIRDRTGADCVYVRGNTMMMRIPDGFKGEAADKILAQLQLLLPASQRNDIYDDDIDARYDIDKYLSQHSAREDST